MDHDDIEARDISRRYVAGQLTEDEERDFEAHLVDCQRCLDTVEADEALRAGLRIVASESAPQATAAAVPRAFTAGRAYFLLKTAAAVLLAVSIGLAAWLARSTARLDAVLGERDQLQQRARQAEQSARTLEQRLSDAAARADAARTAARQDQVVPAAVFALMTVRGSVPADSGPVNRIRIDGDPKLVVFSLEVPAMTDPGTYEVSLKDQKGQPIWSGGAFPASSSDSLGVAIDPSLLPGGDYTLDLSRRSPAGRASLIARYAFRVAAR